MRCFCGRYTSRRSSWVCKSVLRPGWRSAFRRALLYFAFGLSIVSVLQFFTSPGKVYWLFQSEYRSEVLGPFVSRDQYSAFIELVFPIALFEALTDRRRILLNTAIAGTMFASVIAGASRAGSVLLVAEFGAVLLLAALPVSPAHKLRPAFISLFALHSGLWKRSGVDEALAAISGSRSLQISQGNAAIQHRDG